MTPPSSLKFRLSQFDSTLNLKEKAVLDDYIDPYPNYDACAYFNVKTSDLRSVFRFETDDFNINNLSHPNTDLIQFFYDDNGIKYYTLFSNWPNQLRLNFANAMMDNLPSGYPSTNNSTLPEAGALGLPSANITPNKSFLKHDFIRHIAQHVFGTHYGVDLFDNNMALIENLSFLGSDVDGISGVFGQFEKSIRNIDVTLGGTDLPADYNGLKYLTNATRIDPILDQANISRQLMIQIAKYSPDRFFHLDPTTNVQPVPLQDGDTIYFTLTINPATGQENITAGNSNSTPSAVPPKTYLIVLLLGDGTGNTPLVDSAYVADSPYSGFNTTVVLFDESMLNNSSDTISTPSNEMQFMDGWYLKKTIDDSVVLDWVVPVDNSFNAANLETFYVTLNLGKDSSNLPIQALPQISIITDNGAHTYTFVPDNSKVTDNYQIQLRYDVVSSNKSILGYDQLSATGSSSPASGEMITGVEIMMDPSVTDFEFQLTTIGFICSDNLSQVLYLTTVDNWN